MTDTTVNPGADTTANPGTETTVTETNTTINTETKPTTVVDTPAVKTEGWIADDWREKLANGDQKELARLQRFADIGAVYKSYREMETMRSSGQLRQEVDVSKLDEKQLADYRKSIGVPEKAEEYDLGIPEGMVLSSEDEVILGSVLETLHSQNRKPEEVKAIVGSWLEAREVERAAWIEEQNVARTQAEEQLRQEWGGNYLTNVGAVKNLFASMPDGLGDMLITARLSDGSLLGNNPVALRAFAQLATELNPAGTVVPGGGTDQLKSIQDEKAELEALMARDMNAWRKNDTARQRHRDLIDAELKLKARGH